MNYPEELTSRMAAFYRSKKKGTDAVVRPLTIAAKILLSVENLRMSEDELKLAIASQNAELMSQIRSGQAKGLCVLAEGKEEREAIAEFARFFVDEFFLKACQGRRDLLTGNKFKLVKRSCEWITEGLAPVG